MENSSSSSHDVSLTLTAVRLCCLLLCVLCIKDIEGKICDIERELEMESIPVRISSRGKCNKFIIEKRILPKKLHCLDLCNQNSKCKSVNFNSDGSKCLLFRATITEMLGQRCLITVDNDESTITSEVQVKCCQTDVKKIDFLKIAADNTCQDLPGGGYFQQKAILDDK